MAQHQLIAAFHDAWQEAGRGGAIALADPAEAFTYAELFAAVGQLAGRLRAAGVDTGDRVAITLDRSARLAIAVLAVMTAGACPCPLEPGLGRDETRRRFALARLDRVLGDASHLADPALFDMPAECRLDIEALPHAGSHWALDLADDAPGFLLFTSGSSGKPKGVLQSHRGLLTNTLGVIAHTGLDCDDRLLHVMPLHHTNGVNNQIIAPLLAGASVFIAPRFRAEEMPAWLERVRPTILTGVPTMYSRMLPLDFTPGSLAALRMLRCGSAPITAELHRRIEAKFERPLIVSYGLSEATCTSTMNPPDARKLGSVGTVLAGQQIRIEAPDGSSIDGPDRDGEICIAGPTLMLGYLVKGSGGAAEPPGDRVRTGDLGRLDAEGFLFITGRLKDVIIRGGENLSPQLIEDVLCEVEGVAASCVVGRPHDDLGEEPVAFVVRRPEGSRRAADAESLGRIVAKKLSRIHQPVQFFFVDALPENSVGKVDRKVLSVWARARSPFV